MAALALSSTACDLPEAEVGRTDCAPYRPAVVMWSCLRQEEATRNKVSQVLEHINDS